MLTPQPLQTRSFRSPTPPFARISLFPRLPLTPRSLARNRKSFASVRKSRGTTRAAAGGQQPRNPTDRRRRLAPRPDHAPRRPPAPLSHPPSCSRRSQCDSPRSASARPSTQEREKGAENGPRKRRASGGARSLGDGRGGKRRRSRATAAPRAGTKGRTPGRRLPAARWASATRGPLPLPSVSQRERCSSYWEPPGCRGSRR